MASGAQGLPNEVINQVRAARGRMTLPCAIEIENGQNKGRSSKTCVSVFCVFNLIGKTSTRTSQGGLTWGSTAGYLEFQATCLKKLGQVVADPL